MSEDIQEKNSPTIERCPHDGENLYTIVSKDLIRDSSISPDCRWLLVYLLSNNEGWKINTKQIYAHVKGFLGRDRIRDIINEAIEAGYMKRDEFIQNGLKRFKYFLSERPKFKKCLPETGFQGPENPAPENQGPLKNYQSSKEERKNISKKASSADASDLSDYFLKKIKERKPDFKGKALDKWPDQFDLMIRLDGRSKEAIKRVIDYLYEDIAGFTYVQSAKKIREDFDRIEMKIDLSSKKDIISSNRQAALNLKEQYPEQMKGMSFDSKYVRNLAIGKEVPFDLPKETFYDALLNMFGGSR